MSYGTSLAPNVTLTSSSFAPNESASDLFQERANLDGAVAGGVTEGILIMLCWTCLRQLTDGKRLKQINWGLVSYVVLMLSLSTGYIGTNTKYVEMMFIDDRNFPGGPVGFYVNDFPIPMASATIVLYALLNFFSDGLLLYRTFMVWHRNWIIMALPIAMYMASTAMEIIAVFETIKPGAVFFTTVTQSFTLLWFALSISLNLFLTLLIAGKLIAARNSLRQVLGKAHSQVYTSITAIFVESAMLFSMSSIVVIGSYSINSPFQNVALAIHSCVMSISPIMIISRVARGHAYSKEAVTAASSANMTFGSQNGKSSNGTTAISLTNWSRTEYSQADSPKFAESKVGEV